MTKLVAISDLHCGSDVGLTPPYWQQNALQEELWQLYLEFVSLVDEPDVLVINGDAIDGKASRQGSTGLITANRVEQIDMAIESVAMFGAKEVYVVRGTPYHTGVGEDFENILAKTFGTVAKDQLWLDVEGVIFDFKHFIGGSQIPHGRYTSLARDQLWNLLWGELEQQPKANVLIRSHVHYHVFCGNAQWLAMTTPALQGLGSKYGSRIPSGTVDYGIAWFDVDTGRVVDWDSEVVLIKAQKDEPIIVGG